MTTKRPLKVLHLVGDCEDAGGVLSVIRNLDSVSHGTGWEHIVWVNQRYKETRQPSLTYRYSDSVLAESSKHFDLLRQAFPAAKELEKLCQQEHFDVIHAHSRGTLLISLLFARRSKRQVIYTNHNYANSSWIYRWAAKSQRMTTVVLTQNMARHYGLPAGTPRVHQISACFHDDYLTAPLTKRRDLRAASDTIKIIGVGSVIGWKKWDLVVEAIRRLDPALQKRIEFNIWGPTLQFPEAIAFADRLQGAIKQHRLTSIVHLRGSTTDVVGELHKSDLFILPSTNEPCSVALMEALALGLPVIVSKSGGSVDIVKEGCGLHFNVDDPDSLKARLEEAVEAPDQFKSPEMIRETVRERCASQVFELYQTLYSDITS